MEDNKFNATVEALFRGMDSVDRFSSKKEEKVTEKDVADMLNDAE